MPWRWFAPRNLPRSAHAWGRDFATAMATPPTLAIGCGRQAALATRLLRGRAGAVVQILDPRLDPRHWDLVVAPEHDGLRGDNVITLLGSLNPVDDLWLAAARSVFAAFARLPRPRTALLLGGPSSHARFDEPQMEALCAQVAALTARDGGSVLATTSRRTPTGVRRALRWRLANLSGHVWTDPADGSNPYPGVLGWADRIVCTADSVNMLSEACATRVPVYVAGADRLDGRPRRFVDALLGTGRLRHFHAIGDAPTNEPAQLPLRETARVAEHVATRLGL